MTSPERSKPKTRARQKSGAKATGQELEAGASQLPTQFGELDWHERAAFHVSLERADDDAGHVHWQSQAYHEETDSRAMWPGPPGEAMINWICDKAGLTNTTPPGTAPADLQLTIGELRLDEVSTERQIGEPDAIKRLCVGVDFQISGPPACSASAQPSRYVTQILACSPAAGTLTILATDQRQLRPETLAYTVTLEFDLPDIGQYQLLALVLLPDDGAAGITLGPTLSVIP
jgi:hypothetical protein